jgi:uncharacterized protein (DUF2062 family)
MSLQHRFRTLEPRVLAMMDNSMLRRFMPWTDKHDIVSFKREPLARGFAYGLFCSLIPGPLQMLGALVLSAKYKGNVIAAFIATFVSNPITILPLYVLAFLIGAAVIPGQQELAPFASVTNHAFGSTDFFIALTAWMQTLGWPLVVGLPILGGVMAMNGYVIVQILWLWPVWLRLRRMRKMRSLA